MVIQFDNNLHGPDLYTFIGFIGFIGSMIQIICVKVIKY